MIVDFHTHILPRIDDGSSSVNESIKMLIEEAEQGIKYVILTPHFYPQSDDPQRFLERRAEAFYQLSEAIQSAKEKGKISNDIPEMILGAEVYYYQGMSESSCLLDLCIGASRYLLVEMPPAPWPESAYAELRAIYRKQGIIPIIAHIDRYIGPFRTFNIPDKLADMHVFVQMNASALNRKMNAKLMIKLIKQNKIHFVGSDCHNMTNRMPNIKEAINTIKSAVGNDLLHFLNEYEEDVLTH